MTMEVSMRSHGMDRRTFLKRGVGLGLGALAGSSWTQAILAASKERLTILSSIGLDSLHPDDYTVVVTTEAPSAVFLDHLTNRFMISKAAADKYGDQTDQHPIGTGPYKFVSWQRDGNLVMTRNDDY